MHYVAVNTSVSLTGAGPLEHHFLFWLAPEISVTHVSVVFLLADFGREEGGNHLIVQGPQRSRLSGSGDGLMVSSLNKARLRMGVASFTFGLFIYVVALGLYLLHVDFFSSSTQASTAVKASLVAEHRL